MIEQLRQSHRARIKATMLAILFAGTIGVDLYHYLNHWYFHPVPVVISDWYVRSDGGTTTQCAGHTDAAYPGSGSAQACAYLNPQDAYNAANFGDTIKLKAGQTFQTTVDDPFGEWFLPDKGTPPTGTDADYITITTTDPSGTPAALLGYPATLTRITPAMAVNMPHVRAEGSTPLFRVRNGAKYWRLKGLDISNVDNGWQCIVLIQDSGNQGSLADRPDHILIEQNWIHPIEEVGTVLTSGNVARTIENAIYLTVTNSTVQNNAIQGFVGRVKYGGDAGGRMTSAGWLMGGANLTMQNNLVEAWTYAFFAGGGGVPDYAVTGGATVVSCSSATVCTFSDVVDLAVNDPLAVFVATAGVWGSTFAQSISGNTVTFNAPLCHSFDGNNTCASISGTPSNGASTRWKGLQNVETALLKRNIFAHYPEWASLMNGDCGGKGYAELKSARNLTIDGNVFQGCTGITITVRNQTGDFPFASLDGLTISNNYWTGSDNIFVGFLRDSSPTPKSRNVIWHNNLYVGLNTNVSVGLAGGRLSGNFGGGENLTITNNTVAWNKANQPGASLSAWRNFISFTTINVPPQSMGNTVTGLTIQNNILPLGQNQCFGGNGTMSLCWVSPTVSNNVFVNADGWSNEEVNNSWRTLYPNNNFTDTYASVGFTSPDTNLTSAGNYKLLQTSQYISAGTGGSTPGVNFPQLVAHLGYDPFGGFANPSPILNGKAAVSGKARIGIP